MIYIDKQIRLAISSLKQICVTNDATGERLGISGKHVSQILKGEVESIRPSTWETMEPVLRRFISHRATPEQQDATVNETGPQYGRDQSRPIAPELQSLFQWLEHEACADQLAAVLATARAVGFDRDAKHSSPSGLEESQSHAAVA